MKSTQPNSAVGLDSISKGEIDTPVEAFRFISGAPAVETPNFKRRGRIILGAPREALRKRFPRQAPVPDGTVGKADKMRKEILQLSLFPDIYTKVKRVQHPGNTDFGEPHDQMC
jgi:hypothetical protein